LKVVVVDDHQMMREALVELLEKAGTRIVGAFANGHDAIVGATRLRPSAIVMDVAMPIRNGLGATRQLIEAVPGVKVVALSVHADRAYVTAMLQAGVTAYVSKSEAPSELLRALAVVARGETYLSPMLAARFEDPSRSQTRKRFVRADGSSTFERPLTARERDVLELVASGKSSKEIALALRIALPTVETHRRQIMDKLGLRTVAELTKYAIRVGLTPLEF
jgi:two-component system, NarL family, response regulator NreC